MDEQETKILNDLKARAEAAEVAIKNLIKPEEYQKVVDAAKLVQTELDGLKKAQVDAAKTKADADQVAKDKVIADKRATLVKAGLPEDKVKTLSEEGLSIAELTMNVVAQRKPGADMGGGSGGASLVGTPMELATMAYTKK